MKVEMKSLIVETLSGQKMIVEKSSKDEQRQTYELECAGYQFQIQDTWKMGKKNYYLDRSIKAKRIVNVEETDGISFSSKIIFQNENNCFRVGIPSAIYDRKIGEKESTYCSFMEDRLTGNMITFFDEKTGETLTIQKRVPAKQTEKEIRNCGESRFLHRTEIASLGYGCEKTPYFTICWPYEEMEHSVAFDSNGTGIKAFYPLDKDEFSIQLSYKIEIQNYDTFTEALYTEYESLSKMLEEQGEVPICLPFSREDAINYRKDSVKKTYKEFGENGAGFFFHFDPCDGYDSAPSGFGTSFNTIPHETYTHILEYGFTGRQINIALTLAKEELAYISKGEKVIDFFVNHCVKENGWVYSLYDVKENRPFASFGDVTAPRLHYMNYGTQPGNYLRTMTEPINDLLEAYQWYKKRGIHKCKWIQTVERYADFLVNKQNADGSWYRAYSEEGQPIFMNDVPEYSEEENNRGRKASTIIPVIFLCNMAKMYPERKKYMLAAQKAGNYTLQHEVKDELYQGGTMDNPNIVDKEASQYVMAGLYHLYKLTNEAEYLEGAAMAAKQFVTWNYIWNAPMRKETILYEKNFCTKGMGAINSIWCGGVVDIYSLFHIRELYLVGKETGNSFFKKMAAWISGATSQILSCPTDDMGFFDIGMQPEGFGICPQGMDEGMIEKGDIWGTLGWIYSAGISGVERYLNEL